MLTVLNAVERSRQDRELVIGSSIVEVIGDFVKHYFTGMTRGKAWFQWAYERVGERDLEAVRIEYSPKRSAVNREKWIPAGKEREFRLDFTS